MATRRNRFVDNIETKCRCCFKKFKNITESIEITTRIKKLIQEITNMEFKISPLYPSSICKACSIVLKETTAFRNGLIKRQKKLYNLIHVDFDTEENIYYGDVKQEDQLSFSDHIKMEVDVDVKTECYESPSIIIFEAPIISYDTIPTPCKSPSFTNSTNFKDEDLVQKEVFRRSSISSEESSSEESEYSKQLTIQRKCDICGNLFKNVQLHKLRMHGPEAIEKATFSKKCPYCDLICTTVQAVEVHMRQVHLQIKNLFCDICGYRTLVKNNMRHHMKKHTDVKSRKSFSCLHCSKCFYTRPSRKCHHSRRHPDKSSNECFCGSFFKTAIELRSHLKTVHNKLDEFDSTKQTQEKVAPENKNKKHCSFCGKHFLYLKSHVKNFHSNIPKVPKVSKKNLHKKICYQCGKVFSSGSNIDLHIRKVHMKEKNHFCDICGFGTFCKPMMKNHMKVHKDCSWILNETFSCRHCTNIYLTRSGLKDHHQIAHPEKKHNECFCGYRCGSALLLKCHIDTVHNKLVEHKERTFICQSCGKGFKGRIALVAHSKIHENKVFPCDKCPKTFKTKSCLASHSKYHEEPKFSCDFKNCIKKFYRITCLKNHIKVHLGKRDYPCHLCEKKCFKADHLNKHLFTFHKVQGYKCEVPGCTTTMFAKKEFYRRHLSLTHASMLTIQNLFDKLENMESE